MAASIGTKLLAEFLGTYVLVFTIGGNVLGETGTFGVTSIASALMIMIYALGDISGAHFNPAVTLSILIADAGSVAKTKLPVLDAVLYMVAQILGGIAAGLSTFFIFGKTFNLVPGEYGAMPAAIVEVVYTMMLCLVVLSVAHRNDVSGSCKQAFGLAIGFVIVAGGYAGGKVSGGAFNPAVAFGIDVPSAGLGFGWSLAYLGFEALGAILAAVIYRLIYPSMYGGAASTPLAKVIAELVGTFLLTLTVGLNVTTGSPAAAWSIGACLMCCVYALGDASGCHINPAVTLGILASGRAKITVGNAIMYMIVQLVAGALAAFTWLAVTGGHFALGPVAHHTWTHAAVAEALFTMVLVLVVLNEGTVGAPRTFFGLAIGGAVVAGGFAAGSVSGGALNPAVAMGIDVADVVKGGHFSNSLLYFLFEALGGVAAAALFRVTRVAEYKSA